MVSRALHSVGQILLLTQRWPPARWPRRCSLSVSLSLSLSPSLPVSLRLSLSCRTIELFLAKDKRSAWIKYCLAGTAIGGSLTKKSLFLASKFSENPTSHNTTQQLPCFAPGYGCHCYPKVVNPSPRILHDAGPVTHVIKVGINTIKQRHPDIQIIPNYRP